MESGIQHWDNSDAPRSLPHVFTNMLTLHAFCNYQNRPSIGKLRSARVLLMRKLDAWLCVFRLVAVVFGRIKLQRLIYLCFGLPGTRYWANSGAEQGMQLRMAESRPMKANWGGGVVPWTITTQVADSIWYQNSLLLLLVFCVKIIFSIDIC